MGKSESLGTLPSGRYRAGGGSRSGPVPSTKVASASVESLLACLVSQRQISIPLEADGAARWCLNASSKESYRETITGSILPVVRLTDNDM